MFGNSVSKCQSRFIFLCKIFILNIKENTKYLCYQTDK